MKSTSFLTAVALLASAAATGAAAQMNGGKGAGGDGVMDIDPNGAASSYVQKQRRTHKKFVHDLLTEEECNQSMNTRWYDGYLDDYPDPVCHCGQVGSKGTHWKRRFNGCVPDHRYIEGSGAMYLTRKEQCEQANAEWTGQEQGVGNDDFDASDNGGTCSCPEDRWDKRAWLCSRDPVEQ